MAHEHEQLVHKLLEDSGLLDAAEHVGEGMYLFHWGQATIITGIKGTGIVVIAPMFDSLPPTRADEFTRRLLEANAELGGTAAFAVQRDGAVVLQVGRAITGLDAGEFALMLGVVGQFADQYNRELTAEFYS